MNLSQNKKNQSGFTLIEMIVVVGLFAILMVAMFGLFDGFHKIFYTQQTAVDVNGSAESIMTLVQNAALQADQVASTHTFSGNTYSSGANTLILELPSIDSSGAVISGVYDYIVFYSNGSNAYWQLDAGSGSTRLAGSKKISDVLSGMSFTYDNANFSLVNSVTADIQTSGTAKTFTFNNHLKQKIYLRNTY